MSERIEKAAKELERLKAEALEYLKIGERIPVPEEHRETIDALMRDIEATMAGLNAQNHLLKEAKERVWGFLREIVPGGHQYEMLYCRKSHSVTITGRKEQ